VAKTSPTGNIEVLRADARRNRARILAAATDLFVERGPGVPLEEISERAGTGIATLYRRFPDRAALMRVVVLEALERITEEAHRALDEEPDPFDALTRYMHRVLDTRIAAVVPALLEEITLDDDEMLRARDKAARLLQHLIDAAHRAGKLRPDVSFGDISMLIVRLSRPLPGPFPRELNDQLAHRHLELLTDALRPAAERASALAGPAMTLEELRLLQPAQRSRSEPARRRRRALS
jgi:AcrR family transcriptional regulator